MGVEALSPWVSLVAGVLSVGYLVYDEWRSRPSPTTDATTGRRRSVSTAVKNHQDVLVVAVTMFFLAGLAHWYLRSTPLFFPVLFWGTATFVVVLVALGEAGSSDDPDRDRSEGNNNSTDRE